MVGTISLSYDKQIREYRKTSVTTASPLQLVVMLYDGAIRFIEAAKHAMQQKDYYEQNENLIKAQNILLELISSLNMEKGKDIAEHLYSIYYFIYESLIEINLNSNYMLLERCQKMLSDLRESWSEIERQQRECATSGNTNNSNSVEERSVV